MSSRKFPAVLRPTNGSSAATITTDGSTAPKIPVSGQAPLLEEARALSELLKQGWKPRRTIIYAAWDGEEPMLLGSTEWVEAHADELRQHAAVYINTDGNDRGLLTASGSHALEKFINGVARDIEDPETKMSVWQRLQLSSISAAKSRRRSQRTSPARRSSHRRPRLRQRLHRIHRPHRHRQPRSRLLRRSRPGHLSLDLRRLLLVHALLRRRFRLWSRFVTNGGNVGDAPGRRRSSALRLSSISPTPFRNTPRNWRSCYPTSRKKSASAIRKSTKEYSKPRTTRSARRSCRRKKKFLRT